MTISDVLKRLRRYRMDIHRVEIWKEKISNPYLGWVNNKNIFHTVTHNRFRIMVVICR